MTKLGILARMLSEPPEPAALPVSAIAQPVDPVRVVMIKES